MPDKPQTTDDRADAESYIDKIGRGEKPTRREERAFARRSKAKNRAQLRAIIAACPKGLYGEISGRGAQVLQEQAERYDLPIGGRSVDLAAVVHRFHDLIAELARNRKGRDRNGKEEADEALKRARARLVTRQADILDGDYFHRETVIRLFGAIADQLRVAGETLDRRFGGEAQRILNDAIEATFDEMKRTIIQGNGRTRPENADIAPDLFGGLDDE